jgi:CDP-6-deoxy-D-xylo-4-hexulose-3-dehydrase
VQFLDSKRIGTRLLFGGNLLRQPYMRSRQYRVVGELSNADTITEKTFWIGLYPGLGTDHLLYLTDMISEFVHGSARAGAARRSQANT